MLLQGDAVSLGPYELNKIYTGDARELSKAIPNESVDLIFTDPPYAREYHYLYEWLGEEAKRVLKPTGFLLTYCGPYWKDRIMVFLSRHLEYFYDYIEVNNGNSTVLWPKRTISRYKSILAYRQRFSDALPVTNVIGVLQGEGPSKKYHKWGQAPGTARYYIDVFTRDGMTVLDPFVGAGTTAIVCKELNLNWLAFELDPKSAKVAQDRVDGVVYRPEPIQMELGDAVKGE